MIKSLQLPMSQLQHFNVNGRAIEPWKNNYSSFDLENVTVLSCPYLKSTVDCSVIARNHDKLFYWPPLGFVQNKGVCYIGRVATGMPGMTVANYSSVGPLWVTFHVVLNTIYCNGFS